MSRIASGADGCSYEIIAMPIRITTVVTSPNRTRSEWDRLAWLSSVAVYTLHNTASTFRPPMICDWPVMLQLKKSKSTSNSRMTTRGGQEKRASDSRLSRCEKSGAGGAHCGPLNEVPYRSLTSAVSWKHCLIYESLAKALAAYAAQFLRARVPVAL